MLELFNNPIRFISDLPTPIPCELITRFYNAHVLIQCKKQRSWNRAMEATHAFITLGFSTNDCEQASNLHLKPHAGATNKSATSGPRSASMSCAGGLCRGYIGCREVQGLLWSFRALGDQTSARNTLQPLGLTPKHSPLG